MLNVNILRSFEGVSPHVRSHCLTVPPYCSFQAMHLSDRWVFMIMRVALTPAATALAIVAIAISTPVSAQRSDSVKELMGKALSDSERRAVEDLISKLQGRAAATKASPAEAAATVPAPQGPLAANADPLRPRVKVAPVAAGPAPALDMAVARTTPSTATDATPQPTREIKPAMVEPTWSESLAAAAQNIEMPASPSKALPSAALLPAAAVSPATVPANVDAFPGHLLRPAAASPIAPPPPVLQNVLNSAPAVAVRHVLPTVDLEVYFEFGSAKVSHSAMATLTTLGRTLSDPRLADQTFVIAGYTDGKGEPEYNMWLSQIRADAVRQFLIAHFNIAPKQLIAKGFGMKQLKTPSNPLAEKNRRVQIINWTSQLVP
jgi:outer membrane protein OmpA-like peptidoglycan-associated protein